MNYETAISQFVQLPEETRQLFINTYGAAAAPFVWGHQAGVIQLPPGFDTLPAQDLDIWFGTYGPQAPDVWLQQSQQNAQAQTPNAPSGQAGGPQVPNVPPIVQTAGPGDIPSSGTFTLATGSGGRGDPNTGREPQNPSALVQGRPLFVALKGNLPPDLAPVVNYWLQSNTASGASTSAPPPEAIPYLQKALAEGWVAPTPDGLPYLTQTLKVGYTGPVAVQTGQPLRDATTVGAPDAALVQRYRAEHPDLSPQHRTGGSAGRTARSGLLGRPSAPDPASSTGYRAQIR